MHKEMHLFNLFSAWGWGSYIKGWLRWPVVSCYTDFRPVHTKNDNDKDNDKDNDISVHTSEQ